MRSPLFMPSFVIAAAKRGARALGVEYNPDLVELSKRSAAAEGVGDKAMFAQGDMFAADFWAGNVVAFRADGTGAHTVLATGLQQPTSVRPGFGPSRRTAA